MAQSFYNERRRHLVGGDTHPNPAHLALARLEAEYPGEVLVITQNIDDLHERAGSSNLIHMHGELLKIRCERCDVVRESRRDVAVDESCQHCDLFAAIGTSGNVYPASGFVQVANAAGAHTVELNLAASEVTRDFNESRHGPAGEQVPDWVEELLTA